MKEKLYYKLNQNEIDLIKKVEKVTITDYEIKNEFIPVSSMLSIIDDLLYEVNRLQEQVEDLEENIKYNYTKISNIEE